MSEEAGADVALKLAGQEINVRNVKSLNTVATLTSLIILVLIAYGGWVHVVEAKDNGKEIAKELKESNKQVADSLKESQRELGEVLKELARAAREQNCLLSLPQEKRDPELCRRISK
jgi:type VI protein secretion system component VasK